MNRINISMKQLILLLALVAATGAQAKVHFDRLRCEYQTQPVDVDTQHPRFTWTYQGDSTFVQQAYQLRVARSPRLLKKGEGQVVTSRSMSGTYRGGSWIHNARNCDPSLPNETPQSFSINCLGLRLAL